MKRIKIILITVFMVLSLVGCKKPVDDPEPTIPTLSIKDEKVAIKFYEKYTIVPVVTNYEGTPEYVIESNSDITFEGLTVIGGAVGEHEVKVSLKGHPEVYDTITIECLDAPKITIEQLYIELCVGDSHEIKYAIEREEGYEIEVAVSNVISSAEKLSDGLLGVLL